LHLRSQISRGKKRANEPDKKKIKRERTNQTKIPTDLAEQNGKQREEKNHSGQRRSGGRLRFCPVDRGREGRSGRWLPRIYRGLFISRPNPSPPRIDGHSGLVENQVGPPWASFVLEFHYFCSFLSFLRIIVFAKHSCKTDFVPPTMKCLPPLIFRCKNILVIILPISHIV
jgi:hypothetical protein